MLKSVDELESQQYQWVAESEIELADTISSRARYDRFDTSPFREYSVFGTDNMISSFPAVCRLHSFSCQFRSALYARKPA